MLNMPGGTICLQLNTQLFSNVEYNTATRALEVPVIGTRGIRSVTEWIPTANWLHRAEAANANILGHFESKRGRLSSN